MAGGDRSTRNRRAGIFLTAASGAPGAPDAAPSYEQWSALVADVRPMHDHVLDLLGAVFTRLAVQIREDPIIRATVRLQAGRSQIAEPLHLPYVDWIETSTGLLHTAADYGELHPGAGPAALARVCVAGFQGVQHVSGSLSGHADVTERVAEWWAVTRAGLAAGPGDHDS